MTPEEIEKRREDIFALVDGVVGSNLGEANAPAPQAAPKQTPEDVENQKAEIMRYVNSVIDPAKVATSTPAANTSKEVPAQPSTQTAQPIAEVSRPEPPAAFVPPPQQQAAPQQQTITQTSTPRDDTLNKVLAMLSDRVMTDQTTPEEKAMNAQWGQLEKQKLDRLTNSGGDSTQDWAQGLGTAIPMLIGTIMDAATPNAYGQRGTGLGKIAEAGIQNAQNLSQQRTQREQMNAHLAQQAQQIRKGNQNQDFDRLAKLGSMLSERDRINIAQQNMGLRGTDTALKAAAQDFRLNPTNEQAMNFKRFLISKGMDADQVNAMGMAALQQAAHQINVQTDDVHFPTELRQAGARAATTAAAGENARSAAQASNAERDAQTTGIVQAGGVMGRGGAEQKLNAGQYLAPIGRDVVDEGRVAIVRGNEKLTKQSTEEMRASQDMVKAIDDMVDLRKKQQQGIAIPGGYQSEFEAKKSKLMGAIAKANGMATINEGDRDAIDLYLSNTALSFKDLVSGAFGADLKQNQLEGVQKAIHGFDRDTAEFFGYSGYANFRKQKPISKKASAAMGNNYLREGGLGDFVTKPSTSKGSATVGDFD